MILILSWSFRSTETIRIIRDRRMEMGEEGFDYKQNFDLADLICKLRTQARIHIIIMLNPSFLSAIKSAS